MSDPKERDFRPLYLLLLLFLALQIGIYAWISQLFS